METRESKYTQYRKDLTGKKLDVLETSSTCEEDNNHKKHLRDTITATSTLPIDEVMKTLNEDEEYQASLKQQKKMKILKISLISVGLIVLAALIIVFGVIIF